MTQLLEKADITGRLPDYPPWTLESDGMLHAEFTFNDFAQAMMFANSVAYLAELADHHPDICLHGYKNISIRLMSHDAGGVTERDFGMVAKINALPRATPKE